MTAEIRKGDSLVVVDFCMGGIDSERMVVCGDGVLEPSEFVERDTLEDPGFGIVVLERDQPVAGFERLFVLSHLGQGRGLVVPGIDIGGVERQRVVVGLHGCIVFAEIVLGDSLEIMGLGQSREQGKRPVKHDHGFLVPAEIVEFDALPHQCFSITPAHR